MEETSNRLQEPETPFSSMDCPGLTFSLQKIITESFENIESKLISPKNIEDQEINTDQIATFSSLKGSPEAKNSSEVPEKCIQSDHGSSELQDFSSFSESFASKVAESVNSIFDEIFKNNEEETKNDSQGTTKPNKISRKKQKTKNPEMLAEIPEDESLLPSSCESRIKKEEPDTADSLPLKYEKMKDFNDENDQILQENKLPSDPKSHLKLPSIPANVQSDDNFPYEGPEPQKNPESAQELGTQEKKFVLEGEKKTIEIEEWISLKAESDSDQRENEPTPGTKSTKRTPLEKTKEGKVEVEVKRFSLDGKKDKLELKRKTKEPKESLLSPVSASVSNKTTQALSAEGIQKKIRKMTNPSQKECSISPKKEHLSHFVPRNKTGKDEKTKKLEENFKIADQIPLLLKKRLKNENMKPRSTSKGNHEKNNSRSNDTSIMGKSVQHFLAKKQMDKSKFGQNETSKTTVLYEEEKHKEPLGERRAAVDLVQPKNEFLVGEFLVADSNGHGGKPIGLFHLKSSEKLENKARISQRSINKKSNKVEMKISSSELLMKKEESLSKVLTELSRKSSGEKKKTKGKGKCASGLPQETKKTEESSSFKGKIASKAKVAKGKAGESPLKKQIEKEAVKVPKEIIPKGKNASSKSMPKYESSKGKNKGIKKREEPMGRVPSILEKKVESSSFLGKKIGEKTSEATSPLFTKEGELIVAPCFASNPEKENKLKQKTQKERRESPSRLSKTPTISEKKTVEVIKIQRANFKYKDSFLFHSSLAPFVPLNRGDSKSVFDTKSPETRHQMSSELHYSIKPKPACVATRFGLPPPSPKKRPRASTETQILSTKPEVPQPKKERPLSPQKFLPGFKTPQSSSPRIGKAMSHRSSEKRDPSIVRNTYQTFVAQLQEISKIHSIKEKSASSVDKKKNQPNSLKKDQAEQPLAKQRMKEGKLSSSQVLSNSKKQDSSSVMIPQKKDKSLSRHFSEALPLPLKAKLDNKKH